MTDNTDLIARLERWENARSSVADMLLDDVRDAATALRAADAEIARLTDEADTAIQQATNMAEDVESLRTERDEFRRLFTDCHPIHLKGVLEARRLRAAITAALAAVNQPTNANIARAYDILSAALSAPAPVSQPSEEGYHEFAPGERWDCEACGGQSYDSQHRPRTRAEYEQEQNR